MLVLVLVLTLPVLVSIARWTLVMVQQSKAPSCHGKRILLSGGNSSICSCITWLDGDMRCLSCAIAVAHLFVTEMMLVPQNDQKRTLKSTTNNDPIGSSEILALNQFYLVYYFLKRKILQMVFFCEFALVVGCMCPL